MNESNLEQWAGGSKQLQDKINDLKEMKGETVQFDQDKEQKAESRFGDPLKIMKSSTIKSKTKQMNYRLITTLSGH